MITVTLHQTSSPRNKIGKTLEAGIDFSCCLKDDCSILNPRLDVYTDSDITGKNYMYIPAFGRYYFIDDIVSTNNGYWTISAHVDVLETFADSIKENNAIINKQENLDMTNKYLNDGSFISQVDEFNTSYNFSGGFSDSPVFILICAGG